MDPGHDVGPRQREQVVVALAASSGWSAKRSPRKSASSRRWRLDHGAHRAVEDQDPLGEQAVEGVAGVGAHGAEISAPAQAFPSRGPGEGPGDERARRGCRASTSAIGRVAQGLAVERHGDDAEDGGEGADGHQPDGLLRPRRQAAHPAASAPSPSAARVSTRAELCPPRPNEVDIATRRSAGRAALATWSTPTQAGSTSCRLIVGGHHALAQGERGDRGLERAGRAHAVPVHRLGRAHGHPRGRLLAQGELERAHLGGVAGLAGPAVGVDVVDLLRRSPASSIAAVTARAWGSPVGSGSVMW